MNDIKGKIRDLILECWKWCHEKIRGHEDENINILSDLNLLAIFLTEISSEQKAWLLQSAPYVDERYHSSFFLEYLDKLADKNPETIADVYLGMLEGTLPTYDVENIHSIVEKLYKSGFKKKANDICNKYALERYPDLLRDIHDRYNV